MPANKNAFIRYKYLDELLSDRHHYYDIHDLTERCNEKLISNAYEEVGQRTIEKDIHFLEDAPICAEIERFRKNGKSCIRYAKKGFSIFSQELSQEERLLLREVLATLGQFEGLDHFTWLDNFKIGLGIDDEKKIISFSNNHYLKNSSFLGQLFDMISNEQVIELEYYKFAEEGTHKVIVYPYQLKQYNDRWYLLCAPEDNTELILNFALDRLVSATPLPERKYISCKIDLEERFEDIVGVTLNVGKPMQKILLWASDHEWPYIDTKPLHPSQISIRGDQENDLKSEYNLSSGHFFTIECIENFELIRLLCSFGSGLLVLSPHNIKDAVTRRLNEMQDAYGKLNR